MSASRILRWLGLAVLLGVLVSAGLVWLVTTVTTVAASDAERRIQSALSAFGAMPPLLTRDGRGGVARRLVAPPVQPLPITRIVVVAYRAESGRLIRSDVPFWFFKMKAPAAQMFLRDTGLNLQSLGLTAAELSREGPTLVLNETSSDGSRLLVWTE